MELFYYFRLVFCVMGFPQINGTFLLFSLGFLCCEFQNYPQQRAAGEILCVGVGACTITISLRFAAIFVIIKTLIAAQRKFFELAISRFFFEKMQIYS